MQPPEQVHKMVPPRLRGMFNEARRDLQAIREKNQTSFQRMKGGAAAVHLRGPRLVGRKDEKRVQEINKLLTKNLSLVDFFEAVKKAKVEIASIGGEQSRHRANVIVDV